MVRSLRLPGAVALFAALLLSSSPALEAGKRVHNRTIVGEISALDTSSKVLKVDIGLDRHEIVFYNDKTKIKGGDLQIGKDVRIRFSIKSRHQKVATSIKVK